MRVDLSGFEFDLGPIGLLAINDLATADVDHLPSDVTGVVGGEIDVSGGDFDWLPRPLHRHISPETGDLLGRHGGRDQQSPDRANAAVAAGDQRDL